MRDGRYGATFGSLESITQNDVYCGPGTSGTVPDVHYRQSRTRIARAQLLAIWWIFKSTSSPPFLAKRMRLHSELFSEEAGLSIIVSNSASPAVTINFSRSYHDLRTGFFSFDFTSRLSVLDICLLHNVTMI